MAIDRGYTIMRFAALSLLSLHSLVNADFCETGTDYCAASCFGDCADLVCGFGSCKTEAELLLASPTYNCDGTQVHKVRRTRFGAIRRESSQVVMARPPSTGELGHDRVLQHR